VTDRRSFLRALAYAVISAPPIARAQAQTVVRRMGYLKPGAPDSPEETQRESAFLRKLGWIEGENLRVERRYANGTLELLRPLAEDLLRLKVELIVTSGTAATLAAKSATNTIPIVFWSAGDPVRTGLVASLARPGGNITGYSVAQTEMNVKRLAVLREWLPRVHRVGILQNSANPYFRATREELDRGCRTLGIQPIFVEVAGPGELTKAVSEVARRGGRGLLIGSDSLFQDNQKELMRAVLKYALPSTTSRVHIRETGALVSYDPIDSEEMERGASFVDRILRGAKPADLPVEQPTRFELAINLKTANALRITVPPALLARAHEVIE